MIVEFTASWHGCQGILRSRGTLCDQSPHWRCPEGGCTSWPLGTHRETSVCAGRGSPGTLLFSLFHSWPGYQLCQPPHQDVSEPGLASSHRPGPTCYICCRFSGKQFIQAVGIEANDRSLVLTRLWVVVPDMSRVSKLSAVCSFMRLPEALGGNGWQ